MVRRSADCWRKQYPFNSILAQRLQEVQLTLHRLSAVSQNKHSSEIFQRLLQARSDVGKVGVDQVANRHADDPGPLVAKVTCGTVVNIPKLLYGGLDASLSGGRSEEHTSELQSLMRISYAVFCLKNKNII